MAKLERELVVLQNKRRFVDDVICNRLKLHDISDDEITLALDSFQKVDDTYDYLLNMPVRATTQSKLSQLDAEIVLTKRELDCAQLSCARDLWLCDLATLENELTCFEKRKLLRYASLERKGDAKVTKKRKALTSGRGRGLIGVK